MFDNLLQLAADEDKVTLNAMATKFPTLRQYFDLGEKAHALRDRLKTLSYDGDLEGPVKELESWRNWKQKEWQEWQTQNTTIQTALEEATARVAELEARTDTDMTPDEIKEVVKATLKEAGVVDSATLEASMTKLMTEKIGPTLDSRVNDLTLRFEDVFDKVEDVIQTHQGEFKEKLRPKQVFEYMKEHKIADPEAAYKQMTAGRYQEKSQAQIEADKKAAKEEGIAEGKREALKAAGADRSMPVDGRGGSAKPGALMRRAMAKMPKDAEGKTDTSAIALGKGVARAATQAYYDKQAANV